MGKCSLSEYYNGCTMKVNIYIRDKVEVGDTRSIITPEGKIPGKVVKSLRQEYPEIHEGCKNGTGYYKIELEDTNA